MFGNLRDVVHSSRSLKGAPMVDTVGEPMVDTVGELWKGAIGRTGRKPPKE